MKLIRPTYVLLAALTGPATIQAQTAATPAAAAPAAPAGTVAPTPAPRARVSPHETINASIGGRGGPRVTITYGRPYSKDPKTGEIRKIWGHLVKWDKADRLGADEATLLLTQKPLLFGTTEIPAGAYTLTIDGVAAGDFSADALAQGINLVEYPTPMMQQAAEVHALTLKHNNIHFARWRTVQVPLEGAGFDTAAAESALDSLEDQLIVAQRVAAQPKPHRFELAPKV